MGKTITITEEQFGKLVSETAAEIMIEQGKEAPGAAMLYSLSCITFSAVLARKLFSEDKDNG